MSRTQGFNTNIEINEALDLVNQIGTNMVNSFVNVARPIVTEINTNISNNSGKNNFKTHFEKADDKYIVFLPGVKKEDINVKVKDKKIIVKACTSINDDKFLNYNEKNYNLEIELKEKIPSCNLNLKYTNGVLIISDKEEEHVIKVE